MTLIEPFIRRQYSRHISWGIETNQIPRPKKSLLNPTYCLTRWAPDLTIDEQRDVNNDLKLLEMGGTTEKEIAHLRGRNITDVIRERAEFIKEIKKQLGDDAKHWGSNFQEKRDDRHEPAGE